MAIEAVADGTLLGDLAPAIRVVTLAGRNRAERTASLRRALRELKVGVLVNQRAHQYKKSRMAHLAARGLGVRVVEALHASIGFDERTLDASGLRRRWRAWKTRRHYRLTYARCDAFVVLSERLIPELRRFAGLRETTKCVAIANPLTLTPAPGPKAKRLLYVGRLCEREKRVSRVLEVWGRLAARFPEWRLDVVGDGPDRAALERLAQGLPRVAFHGTQPPAPFYAKARIVVLTSAFESFGLVLREGMAAGCVPVALASFPALHDLIDGTNGVAVAPPYDAAGFAATLGRVMADETLREALAAHARADAAAFSPEAAAERWDALLRHLLAAGTPRLGP